MGNARVFGVSSGAGEGDARTGRDHDRQYDEDQQGGHRVLPPLRQGRPWRHRVVNRRGGHGRRRRLRRGGRARPFGHGRTRPPGRRRPRQRRPYAAGRCGGRTVAAHLDDDAHDGHHVDVDTDRSRPGHRPRILRQPVIGERILGPGRRPHRRVIAGNRWTTITYAGDVRRHAAYGRCTVTPPRAVARPSRTTIGRSRVGSGHRQVRQGPLVAGEHRLIVARLEPRIGERTRGRHPRVVRLIERLERGTAVLVVTESARPGIGVRRSGPWPCGRSANERGTRHVRNDRAADGFRCGVPGRGVGVRWQGHQAGGHAGGQDDGR
jgi:hypothetical protein